MKFLLLLKLECFKIRRSPSLWIILAGTLCLGSFLFQWQLEQYVHQAQLATLQEGRVYGVTTEVIKPFWGWCLFILAMITPILCLLFVNLERHQKSFDFWVSYRIPALPLLMSKFVSLSLCLCAFIFLLSLLPLSLKLITMIDLGLTLSGALPVLCSSLFILSLSLCLNFLIANPSLSLLSTYAMVGFLSFLPLWPSIQQLISHVGQLSFLSHAHAMMNGQIYWINLIYFLCFIISILSLSYITSKVSLTRSKGNFQ